MKNRFLIKQDFKNVHIGYLDKAVGITGIQFQVSSPWTVVYYSKFPVLELYYIIQSFES